VSHHDEKFREAVSDLASAAPLATSLRRELGEQTHEAMTPEAAVDQILRADKRVQPTKGAR